MFGIAEAHAIAGALQYLTPEQQVQFDLSMQRQGIESQAMRSIDLYGFASQRNDMANAMQRPKLFPRSEGAKANRISRHMEWRREQIQLRMIAHAKRWDLILAAIGFAPLAIGCLSQLWALGLRMIVA